ncbi:MAG TPA: hypothetical protein VFU73_03065, partial [Actinocrinis sp.]|nr:hypothetical protein [Actinocrinis sp.]
MNTERFEERLMLELKSHVRERAQARQAAEDGVAAGVETLVARRRGRRRPRFGTVAGAAGLTAAIAAAVVTSTSGTLADGAPHHPLFHAVNAAYSVQQEPTGLVKLTILDANGRPNVDELRSDLAKAGINAKVLADVPDCQHPQPRPSPGETPLPLPPADAVTAHSAIENGKLVFYMDPRLVVPGEMFSVLFGKSLQTTEMALSRP